MKQLPYSIRAFLKSQDLYLLSEYTYTVKAHDGWRFKGMYFLPEESIKPFSRLIYTIEMTDSGEVIVLECDDKFQNFRLLANNYIHPE